MDADVLTFGQGTPGQRGYRIADQLITQGVMKDTTLLFPVQHEQRWVLIVVQPERLFPDDPPTITFVDSGTDSSNDHPFVYSLIDAVCNVVYHFHDCRVSPEQKFYAPLSRDGDFALLHHISGFLRPKTEPHLKQRYSTKFITFFRLLTIHSCYLLKNPGGTLLQLSIAFHR